jgi:RNA polymerase sigma-70 factor (ECF subfamily)
MSVLELSDGDLLESGSASDFGRFYDRHLDVVLAFVGRRIRQPEAMFDLTAETFARALEHRTQYRAEKGPAIAWLLGIARNLIIDSARRGRIEADSRVRLGMSVVELDDRQLAAISERGGRDLGAALAALPEEQLAAVIRRVVLEEPYAVIADGLRCSEHVVRKRVSRGLAALRANLEDQR